MKTAKECWISNGLNPDYYIDSVEAAMEEYAAQRTPASGSVPPLPDWNDVIKGIDDSRFNHMPDCQSVREGARIMYDRLYIMLSRQQ